MINKYVILKNMINLEMFNLVAIKIISLGLLMLIGFAAGKAKILTNEANHTLAELLIKITLPCTMIMAMQRQFSKELLINGGIVLAVSFVVYFAFMVIGAMLCRVMRVNPSKIGVWTFALVFPNVGYMGIPLLDAVYGEKIMFFVAMNNMAFNILCFTIGITIMKGELFKKRKGSKVKQSFQFNFPIAATILGLILFVLRIEIPEPVASTVKTAGDMTPPISMFIIGSMLSRCKFKEVFAGAKDYIHIALRLLVLPAAVFFALSSFIKDEFMLASLVMLSAMPAGTITAIFSVRYNADEVLASKLVVLSTVLSIITIPIIALLL